MIASRRWLVVDGYSQTVYHQQAVWEQLVPDTWLVYLKGVSGIFYAAKVLKQE